MKHFFITISILLVLSIILMIFVSPLFAYVFQFLSLAVLLIVDSLPEKLKGGKNKNGMAKKSK